MNKGPAAPRGRGERAGLTREAIVSTGLALSRETPSGGFSVRLLADRLGVDSMAVHYWFRGRDLLLDAIAVQALASLSFPAAEGPWESRLRAVAASLSEMVAAHPGIAWAERRLDSAAGATVVLHAVQHALASSGLPDRDVHSAARTLLDLAIAQSPATRDDGRFRAGVGLIVDGLRMRALERRAAAGER